MKKPLRTVLGVVPGYHGIAIIAIVASIPPAPMFYGTAAEASDEPDPHYELIAAAKQRRMPYVSVEKPQAPALWTVRSRYDGLIESTARRHDVDPALVKAIVQAESAFDPRAVSRAGARGLMQVLPTTASRFSISNLLDPSENLRAGVLYLKHLLELFDGDVSMAVAAYNAGPSTVRRHQGIPPYVETRSYLTKVMSLRNAYADQARRS